MFCYSKSRNGYIFSNKSTVNTTVVILELKFIQAQVSRQVHFYWTKTNHLVITLWDSRHKSMGLTLFILYSQLNIMFSYIFFHSCCYNLCTVFSYIPCFVFSAAFCIQIYKHCNLYSKLYTLFCIASPGECRSPMESVCGSGTLCVLECRVHDAKWDGLSLQRLVSAHSCIDCILITISTALLVHHNTSILCMNCIFDVIMLCSLWSKLLLSY